MMDKDWDEDDAWLVDVACWVEDDCEGEQVGADDVDDVLELEEDMDVATDVAFTELEKFDVEEEVTWIEVDDVE